MNSAIAANSARTSSGISVSARHLPAAASCASASLSAQPAAAGRLDQVGRVQQVLLAERVRAGQQLAQLLAGRAAAGERGDHRQ